MSLINTNFKKINKIMKDVKNKTVVVQKNYHVHKLFIKTEYVHYEK